MANKLAKPKNKRPVKTAVWLLLPVILVIGLVPLIVKEYQYSNRLNDYAWFSNEEKTIDFFLAWKSYILIAIAVVMTVIIAYKVAKEKKKLKLTHALIPLGVYAAAVIISTIFSIDHYFSLHGIFEQFESMWVLLGYCVVVFYAFLFINSELDLQEILKWFFYSTCVVVFIGLTQAVGWDFYQTQLGKTLITTGRTPEQLESLIFNFEKGRTYMSFYNPNYVGVYVSMTAPVFLIPAIFSKKGLDKVKYGAVFAALMVCLVKSKSSTGVLAMGVSLCLLAVLLKDYYKKYWKQIFAVIFLAIIGFIAYDQLNDHVFTHKFANLFTKTPVEGFLSEIQTNEDHLAITFGGEKLIAKLVESEDGFQVDLREEDGTEISAVLQEDAKSAVQDERFDEMSFFVADFGEFYGLGMELYGETWYFTNQAGDGTYYYINKYGKLDKIVTPDSMVFNGIEHFATDRGYEWSRTIPLILKRPFFGSGPDTFTLIFPQDDYVGNYNFVYMRGLMTKPHSLYLQIASQTGLIALAALLVFYGIYFVSSIRLYWKKGFHSYLSQMGIAVLIGTFAYMVAGIANDSTIAVAPIFYAFMGIGLAINHLVKKEE